ncbi:hypothetical protein GCM10009742_08040 [Kribbella karoonensis]|uniref:Uncharacterized protein n=1 Tax=Kribbella karoonensis TaxID=324851 RepID=A0ABN2D4L8_9ACTN
MGTYPARHRQHAHNQRPPIQRNKRMRGSYLNAHQQALPALAARTRRRPLSGAGRGAVDPAGRSAPADAARPAQNKGIGARDASSSIGTNARLMASGLVFPDHVGNNPAFTRCLVPC